MRHDLLGDSRSTHVDHGFLCIGKLLDHPDTFELCMQLVLYDLSLDGTYPCPIQETRQSIPLDFIPLRVRHAA